MKISNKIASALVVLATVMAFGLMVAAPAVAETDAVSDAWNGFVAYGWMATIGCIIGAIIIWMIWGDGEYENAAKAVAVILVVIGFAAGLGIGVAAPDSGGQAGAVQPEFGATANAANNTTHATLGVNAYTWAVLYDISDAAISTGEATTFNMTVRRTDQLSDFYYTNAYVDMDTVEDISNAGVPVSLIALSGTQPRVTWTDSQGNALTNTVEIESVPQPETKIETMTCSIYLSDTAIGAMVTNSQSVSTFNIVVATETTDSTGQPVAYSNPITIPITVVVTSQA